MARQRKSSTSGRDDISIANPLDSLFRLPRFSPVNLSLFEDRRTYHPERAARPAFSLPRMASRLVAREARGRSGRQTKAPVAFADPNRVLVCVRRKRRKEVLHARGIAGSRGFRRPRRSFYSEVSCR